MRRYLPNEFYGDFVEFSFEKWRKNLYRFLFMTGITIFIIVFLGLVIRQEKTSDYLNKLGDFIDQQMSAETQTAVFGSFGLFVILLPFYTDLLHLIRKYWLYPKDSLTQQTTVRIQVKELIIHPKPRNSNVTPKTHYIKVSHPASGRLISIDVDGAWFAEVHEGDSVRANYHPAGGNIMYLKKS